ncbi:MAG: sugar ABC transporter permease [Planctomycetota bacterium]|nr:MAG: sugar ABC transporter permease [Planctomycetota bacterium]
MAYQSRIRWAGYALLAPFVLVFLIFLVLPLVQAGVLALKQTYGPQASVWVGLENFRHLANDPLFWRAVSNTLIYTASTILIQLPLALGLAMVLNHPKIRGRGIYRLIFFSPQLMGMVFVSMLAGLIFEKRSGLVNQALHAAFGTSLDFPWLQVYIMPTLIISTLWMYVGFNMVYFLAALQNVERSLVEAASVDGAGPWARFRHVTIPAIRPVGSFVVLLSVIGSLQLFELPYVMLDGSAGPANRGLTIVLYLYQNGFEIGDLGYASAIGWVLGLMLVVAAALQMRLARERG